MADDWDVLDEPIGSTTSWTRVNVGEAFPGVPTPLTWTWAGPASDAGVTRGWVKMGVFPRSQSKPSSDVAAHFVAICHGRALLNIDRLRSIGDRIPFNSGAKVEQTLFSSEQVSAVGAPVRRRYPFVATQLPVAMVRARRALLASVPGTEAWWIDCVHRVTGDGVAAARRCLVDSAQRYADLAMHQAQTTVAGQGLFEALTGLCRRYGLPDTSAGSLATTTEPSPEMRTVEDLWGFAHGSLSLESFLGRHGYHAPVQGELAVPSWRVDPGPVRSLADTYRRRSADDDPAAVQRRRREERDAIQRTLLERLPRVAVPVVNGLLAAVRAYVPLREVARLQFLQCYDVARAAATRLGEDLVGQGALDAPGDVFYLTLEELAGGAPPAGLVARRRQRRAEYEAYDLPLRFTGVPEPRPVAPPSSPGRLVGIGGSAGVAEGRARVVEGPDDPNELEDGEVLVAETTNPSYASFFLVASAVVVDIGGMLSHAAIVAREMGIPCVINTGIARHTIKTGDLIRVDGDRGLVEVIEQAGG
jgi:pyruvate,water dikinase